MAADDDASGTEDQTVVIPIATLLSNDTHGGDGGALSLTGVSSPLGGSAVINGANVDFTPTANLCGLDAASFVYTVSDGTDTDTATVTIDLTCVNDPPVATDDSYTTNEDTNLVLDATAAGSNDSPVDNDTDIDSATLTVTAVDNAVGGTVSLVSGTITFDPSNDVCEPGDYGFDYTVSDGGAVTDTGHVDVTITCVNDLPTFGTFPANAGGQYTDPVDANTTMAGVQALTLSASDIESAASTLVFSVVAGQCDSGGVALPEDLVLTNNGNGTATISGRFDIIPGTYTPCIVVTDGSGQTAQKLTLSVTKEDASIVDIGIPYPTMEVQTPPLGDADGINVSGTFTEANDGYPSTNLDPPGSQDTKTTSRGATDVKFDFNPVGSGTQGKTCTDTGVPVGNGVACGTINDLTPDVYQIDADIQGAWFDGIGIGSLLVSDPSLGFSTGGGTLTLTGVSAPWNNAKVNFGFTGKKVNKTWKGSILVVIHTINGPYVMKTNAFGGVTNSVTGAPPNQLWSTSMFGKATYAVPDSQTNPYCGAGIRKCGNFTLSISAQDIAEPGKNTDKFKFKLMPPSGNTPAFDTQYIVIAGGNVQVPH